mgnify:CR=1 FL=1
MVEMFTFFSFRFVLFRIHISHFFLNVLLDVNPHFFLNLPKNENYRLINFIVYNLLLLLYCERGSIPIDEFVWVL